jgi:hypothetical protein
VFQELMLKVYRAGIVGPVPAFPDQLEQRITRYLQGDAPAIVADTGPPVVATVESLKVVVPGKVEGR